MMDNIDEVADKRLIALQAIEKEKLRVAKTYNRKVRLKEFQVGDSGGAGRQAGLGRKGIHKV